MSDQGMNIDGQDAWETPPEPGVLPTQPIVPATPYAPPAAIYDAGVPQRPYEPPQAPLYANPPSYGGYGQVAQPHYGAGVVTTQQDHSVQAVFAWIITVFTFGYMLPWAIAATRGKSNSAAIGLLNFLLGWTFVGWVVSLVMACSAHSAVGYGPSITTHVTIAQQFPSPPPPPTYAPPPSPPAVPPGWYPDSSGLQRYWDGTAWTQHTAG
jgi:hypothetical protein